MVHQDDVSKNHPDGVSREISSMKEWKCAKIYERDDTKDIRPWSSTSPSWTQSLRRFFNIHERTGVSKTTCGMKRVPLLSLKNVRTIFTFFLENFFFDYEFLFCQNIYFTLKGWICKVLTRKARIFIGTTSVWRLFGKLSALEYKSCGVWNSRVIFSGLGFSSHAS